MKHSQGPWKIDEDGDVVDFYGRTVPVVGVHTPPSHFKQTMQEAKANARLMAAAPELLEALQEMVQWQMDHMSGKSTKGYPGTQAMTAIRKALGDNHES